MMGISKGHCGGSDPENYSRAWGSIRGLTKVWQVTDLIPRIISGKLIK